MLHPPYTRTAQQGNSKAKNQDSWKLLISWSPLEIAPFLMDPRNFYTLILQYAWKFHVVNPPVGIFFWNSPLNSAAVSSNLVATWWLIKDENQTN